MYMKIEHAILIFVSISETQHQKHETHIEHTFIFFSFNVTLFLTSVFNILHVNCLSLGCCNKNTLDWVA